MEDLIESVTRGNATEVKVVLASIALALGIYQLGLIAVGYGKLRLPFLAARPAAATHRAVGDTIVLVLVATAIMCVGYFGFEDDATLHVVSAIALLAVLALKIVVVRWWHALGPPPSGPRDLRVAAARADVDHLGRCVPGRHLMA